MIIVIDIETQGLDATRFILGVMYYENGTHETFYSCRDMWARLYYIAEKQRSYKKNVFVYAHNMAYDFYGLTYHLFQQDEIEEDFRFISLSRPFIVQFKNITFYDTLSLFNMSLGHIGDMIGEKKLTRLPCLEEGTATFADYPLIEKYCVQDCRILMEGIRYLKDMCFTLFGYRPRRLSTAPKFAITTFMKYLKGTGYWYRINDPQQRSEIYKTRYEHDWRIAYRGARVEAIRLGEFPDATLLDINKHYGHVMATMRFPDLRKETAFTQEELEREHLPSFLSHLGYMSCTVRVPKLQMGYLPIRYKEKLYFPRKEGLLLKSIWTLPELLYAYHLGYDITEVERAVVYPEMDNIFTSYITQLYDLCLQKTPQIQFIGKMCINYLFGKLGQKRVFTETKLVHRDDVSLHTDWAVSGGIGPYYHITRPLPRQKQGYFVTPVLPALITAHARTLLYSTLRRIDYEDLLYCDTDSIMLTRFHKYSHLFSIGDALGQWKIVSQYQPAVIKGEKYYSIGPHIKMAGVPQQYANERTFHTGAVEKQELIGLKRAKHRTELGTFKTKELILTGGSKHLDDITEDFIQDY